MRRYTDQDIIDKAVIVKSIAGLLKTLGLRCAGGNYHQVKRNLQRLNVDCRHWTGQGWNKDEQLKDWSQYARAHNCKKHLIRKRGHQCEGRCRKKTWFGQPIPLELHHKDGDRTNNDESNLELCCCNCHALTDNYKNKKRDVVERIHSGFKTHRV